MSAHTPGPWEWDETRKEIRAPCTQEFGRDYRADYDDDGNAIRHYTCIVETDGGCYPPRDEDARLIAAAPDMLATLIIAADTLHDAASALDLFGKHVAAEAIKLAEKYCRAAIAKAEGAA